VCLLVPEREKEYFISFVPVPREAVQKVSFIRKWNTDPLESVAVLSEVVQKVKFIIRWHTDSLANPAKGGANGH
jgi:hypothetical protein